jgi:hypothetical protein
MANSNPKTDHLNKFKKGQSGNPKGKPKGTLNMSTRLKLLLENDISFTVKGRKITKDGMRWALDGLIAKAAKGDVPAIKEIFDRTEGKAKQSISLGNHEGESFKTEQKLTKEQIDQIVRIGNDKQDTL